MIEFSDLSDQMVEEAVIVTLLTQPESMPEVTAWMTPEMFYMPHMAFIYRAIRNIYDRGEQPDYILADTEIRRINPEEYEKIGGINVLAQAFYQIRHAENLIYYVAEVRNRYLRRTLRVLFTSLAQEAEIFATQPEKLIEKAETKLLEIRENNLCTGSLATLEEVTAQAIETHRRRQDEREKITYSGFKQLDALIWGLQPGELSILAGRPGDGKTAIALQLATNVAAAGKTVCFFSLEMNSFQLVNRILTGYTSIPPHMFRTSIHLQETDFEHMEQTRRRFATMRLFLDYTPGNTVENIRAQIQLLKRRGGCDLVIVDYLHLLAGLTRQGETSDMVIGRIIRALKQLALETDCAIVVLSQMNRQSENRSDQSYRPNLSDLRDSGVIEQVADLVAFVYRPSRYGIVKDEKTGRSLEDIVQLILRKNRHGVTGTVNLHHNSTFTRFEDEEDN